MSISRKIVATLYSHLILLCALCLAGCDGTSNSAGTTQTDANRQWGGGVGSSNRSNLKSDYPNAKTDSITACYGTVNDIHGDEHWAFMILADFEGFCNPGTSAAPKGTRKYKGVLRAEDGRLVQWQCETTDGKTGQITINGSAYDLSKGLLFLVSTDSGHVDVQQIEHDLTQFKPDEEPVEGPVGDGNIFEPDSTVQISP